MYGRFYNTGDVIGVILDMDRGLIAFIKDGLDQFSTQKKLLILVSHIGSFALAALMEIEAEWIAKFYTRLFHCH